MKKSITLAITFICLLSFFSSCATVTIPNSAEAEEKLTSLGYIVQVDIHYGDMVSIYNIEQVTILTADKGEDFIQAYFFTNEVDTETYFEDHETSLSQNVEVVKKNKYSIYRGTQTAVDDFLS